MSLSLLSILDCTSKLYLPAFKLGNCMVLFLDQGEKLLVSLYLYKTFLGFERCTVLKVMEILFSELEKFTFLSKNKESTF